MVNKTLKPNKATQLTGGYYRTFTHLDYIKNTVKGSYAISSNTISGKNGDHPQPSTVTVSDFKCNIPSNAVVKRITVHYKHAKRGVCNGSMCTNAPNVCNIPKPTVTLWQPDGSDWVSMAKKKAEAPIKDNGAHQKLVFNGLWNASIVNSKKFEISMEYPDNTNNHKGYLLLSFIYISIDYFVPSFSLNVGSANTDKVYNNGEYHLKLSLSDSNLTGKTSTINISVPAGFTYRGVAGKMNGTITQPSAHSLQWTPKMSSSGMGPSGVKLTPSAALLELVFDVSVSFSSSEDHKSFNFTASRSGTSTLKTHSAVIYKQTPEQTGDDSGEQHFEDDTSSTVQPEIASVVLDEEFNYSLNVDDESYEGIVQIIKEYGDSQGWWTGLTSDEIREEIIEHTTIVIFNLASYKLSINQRIKTYYGGQWVDNHVVQGYLSDLATTKTITAQFKGISVGYDEIPINVRYVHGGNSKVLYDFFPAWKFDIKPAESDLSTPNMSILTLTNEELDRLGTGYNYTVQSDLELVTSETYIRDWYKNFRLGVFNNKIASNCSTYYLQESTENSLDGEIKLTSLYDITDGYLKIKGDKAINLTIKGTTYNITTSYSTIDLYNEYVLAVLYEKNGNDNVILTIEQYDSSNNKVDEFTYHINFNAEQDTILTEKETDSTDYTSLTEEQIFNNAEYWSTTTAGLNTSNNTECEFTYNENYPLYIIITGDYPEGSQSSNTIKFDEPCIIETDGYTERLINGKYPIPIENTIRTDDSSEITLESYNISDTIVIYDYPLEENYGTNTEQAIRGIELTGDIEQSDRVIVYAKLISPDGESRQRSIVLDEYETLIDSDHNFSIGGNGDLWGFNTLELTELEKWECQLAISNNLEETTSNLNFKNLQLTFYVEQVEDQDITCYIEGEDIRYYGVFLTNATIPEGLETNTAYLKVDGTDTNDAYRQNITEKTITIEFELGNNCDLEGNTLSRRELAKLLVNDRDEYNRPIPKRIEFSHYPDVYWEYIMEDAIEDKIEVGTYTDGKIKLTIPDGTAYDKEPTTTSNMGYVNGLATINPVIIVKPTDEVITITETVSGQEFNIGYSNWNNRIIEIDCLNKNVWLLENEDDQNPININKYVDWNSDWFRLKGEYNFNGTNCVIRTVETRERW